VRDPPRPEETEQKASESEKAEEESQNKSEDTKEEGKDKKKEDDAPPPPHGDKTPWQVFTETFRTELKASKEWNESTKELTGKVEAFTESEGVRRAREASEAASSGASKVIKGTGKAIGSTAAWTWNTSAVQGIRAGVNATGRGIEKATRPVRETQAFKEISEAMDDGSSSRYGGWVEKEERHRMREARNLKENPSGKPVEKMEEDPK
jgi:import inner membrane translocase subunit TIM44